MWKWFIVPTFHVQALQLTPSIGIGLLICFLTSHVQETDDMAFSFEFSFELVLKKTLEPIFLSVMLLICGWIISLFM